MKFDFVIGNPPYQEPTESTRDKPVYNAFMDAAFTVSNKVELVTPGRFLFNAGATSKEWNKKMLSDEHFKVLEYEPNATKIFPSVGFKGGVAITYRDSSKVFGAIESFSIYPELNSILQKIKTLLDSSFSVIMFGQGSYKYSEKMHIEHPEIKYKEDKDGNNIGILSKGHDNDIATNALDKLHNVVMYDNEPTDDYSYLKVFGRKDTGRAVCYIREDYICPHPNLMKYKVILPKANGTGELGEVLTSPIIGEPRLLVTQTFLTIGCFNERKEAEACMKYIKTKFARVLLGILKITQDNPPEKWKYVPLQDFNDNSDIDWSVSITDIDKQLYKKYGLSQEEIDFIETNVKEME